MTTTGVLSYCHIADKEGCHWTWEPWERQGKKKEMKKQNTGKEIRKDRKKERRDKRGQR